MRTNLVSPLGALWRGAAAGLAASAAMNVWFALAGKHMPPPREGAFTPPEKVQETELPTETVARRFVGGFMKRGQLNRASKKKAGQLVHFAFGAGWGALYGLVAETIPAVRTPAGALAFGTFVWSASDHAILPAFRLAPWPGGVTAKGHAFWFATHLVYGAALGSSFMTLRPRSFAAFALEAIVRRIGLAHELTPLERARAAIAGRLSRVAAAAL